MWRWGSSRPPTSTWTTAGCRPGSRCPATPICSPTSSRRYRPSTFGPDRYPFPIPNGWFVVAEASEIGPGEVRALHAFDRDLVLYRAADGTPRVLDAHCPHLGAHLAVGGRVEDELPALPVPRLEVRRRVAASASRSPTAT